MENLISYSDNQYDKFDIHKDLYHHSIKGNTFTKSFLDKVIKSNKFEMYYDIHGSYRYYLYRRMKGVDKWYRNDLFDFLHPIGNSFSEGKLLFVRNRKNGRIDNIIVRSLLDEISSRIESNLIVYTSSDHAISRAKMRVPELYDRDTNKVDDWLLKQINYNSSKCKPKTCYAAISLLNHNFEQCDYYMDQQGHVYVVINHTVITIHCNESERWTKN